MTRQISTRLSGGALALFVLLALHSPASAEWKEKVLYSFQGVPDGATPAGGVVFGKDGNLYGATTDGGANFCAPTQCGTVFQLAPPAEQGDPWTETVIHIFQGDTNGDGNTPAGGVIFDQAGNLYGTTAYGGSGNCPLRGKVGCGTVYQMEPPSTKGGSWTEKILYSFKGGKDGQLPQGDLVFDGAGNLYGATEYGGGYGSCNWPFYRHCGTVFELSPPQAKDGRWTEKVLYSFKGVAAGKLSGDGANPNGGLVLDAKGAIYGTTYFGGNNVKGECKGGVGGTGCGIVFALQPPTKKGGAWTEKMLHQFNGHDGPNSAAGFIFDENGNLYGTTFFVPGPYGLVFELKKPSGKVNSWPETILYSFTDADDGANPDAAVVRDTAGRVYGTALGGRTHLGVVFRLNLPMQAPSPMLTTLYNFAGSPDGDHPTASLVFDRLGNLYGTTIWGGTGQACQGCGTIFEVEP